VSSSLSTERATEIRPTVDDASWLVALDLDGTLLNEEGSISDAVIKQVRRLDAAGHQVMLATGRSSATTIPVLEHLGITPRFPGLLQRRHHSAP
jgi:phosphoglycolate phosphatase-like HAD superfamily hydrolase